MTFRDLLADTFRTLWAHKLRTCLTLFGIAWGVISITLMVAAGEGLRVGQRQRTETFGKDIMIVVAGRTSLQAGGLRAGRRVTWESADHLLVKQEATGCEFVVPELGNAAPVRSAFNSASLTVTGSLPPFAEIRSIPVGEGRFYNWEDEALARRVAFLGTDAKKQLFGSRAALGETIRLGDFPYTVIGVMERKEQNSSYDGFDVNKIFVPFATMLRDFPNKPPSTPHSVDRLIVTPKSYEQHEACKSQVQRALGRLHSFDPHDKEAASMWDTVENAKNVRRIFDGMESFLAAVGRDDSLSGRYRRDERDAGGRTRANPGDRSAEGRGSERAGHRAAVLCRDAHPGLLERRPGNGCRLRALRAGQPAAHAAVLRRHAGRVGARTSLLRPARHCGGALGAVSCQSRGAG